MTKKEGPNVNTCPVCKGQFGDEVWDKDKGCCVQCAKKETKPTEPHKTEFGPQTPTGTPNAETKAKVVSVDAEAIREKIADHEKAIVELEGQLQKIKEQGQEAIRQLQEKANQVVAMIRQRNGAIAGLKDLIGEA
jgi:hypothetical protein